MVVVIESLPELCLKGNVFKNNWVLMESIHKKKVEKAREKTLSDQFEACRAKGKAVRERKMVRRVERLAQGIPIDASTPAPARNNTAPFFISIIFATWILKISMKILVLTLTFDVQGLLRKQRNRHLSPSFVEFLT